MVSFTFHIYYCIDKILSSSKHLEFEISIELSVLRSPESKKSGFYKMSVCLHVCPYSELQKKTTGSILIKFGVFKSIGLL